MANPYMPLFVGDYLKDTGELTNEEHGVYLKLLMFMWAQGGFLRNDPRILCRLTGVSYRRWAPIWSNLERFFYVEGDTLRHTKVEKTLQKAREISELRARAAAKKYTKNSKENNKTPPAIADRLDMQKHPIQTKGLDSSLREENPNLAIDEMKHAAASPPSPLEGGGDATETVQQIPTLPDAAREVLAQLRDLNARGKVSLREIDQFKKAVQGERSGRVLLIPAYEPPEAVAAVLNQPKLKAIEGGKQ